jgi:hypothetical protein
MEEMGVSESSTGRDFQFWIDGGFFRSTGLLFSNGEKARKDEWSGSATA